LFRRIWLAAGKDFPNFPVRANSHHLRKSATALAHIFGDDQLKGSVHTALNHSAETNASAYQNTIRQHTVVTAKGKLTDLMATHSGELKSVLFGRARFAF